MEKKRWKSDTRLFQIQKLEEKTSRKMYLQGTPGYASSTHSFLFQFLVLSSFYFVVTATTCLFRKLLYTPERKGAITLFIHRKLTAYSMFVFWKDGSKGILCYKATRIE